MSYFWVLQCCLNIIIIIIISIIVVFPCVYPYIHNHPFLFPVPAFHLFIHLLPYICRIILTSLSLYISSLIMSFHPLCFPFHSFHSPFIYLFFCLFSLLPSAFPILSPSFHPIAPWLSTLTFCPVCLAYLLALFPFFLLPFTPLSVLICRREGSVHRESCTEVLPGGDRGGSGGSCRIRCT